MQAWETYYTIRYTIGTSKKDIDRLLAENRIYWKSYHLIQDATINQWFEFEKIINPLEKALFGSILGRHPDGNSSELEVLKQIQRMTDNCKGFPEFRFVLYGEQYE